MASYPARPAIIAKKYFLLFDLNLVLYLLEKTIFNDPTQNCKIKGSGSDWKGLPDTKSLFHAQPNCGLPIGNLTSQLFGNVYMNPFDHWIMKTFNIRYYGRYVDDFVIMHPDKFLLQSLIPRISEYLQNNLMLRLHPDKIYLQHFSKGVQYLGAIIKPHRIYIAARTKGNFYEAIEKQNLIARDHKPSKQEQESFLSSMNSYLGIMKHFKTHKLRKHLHKKHLSGWWGNYVRIVKFEKYVLKNKMVKRETHNILLQPKSS